MFLFLWVKRSISFRHGKRDVSFYKTILYEIGLLDKYPIWQTLKDGDVFCWIRICLAVQRRRAGHVFRKDGLQYFRNSITLYLGWPGNKAHRLTCTSICMSIAQQSMMVSLLHACTVSLSRNYLSIWGACCSKQGNTLSSPKYTAPESYPHSTQIPSSIVIPTKQMIPRFACPILRN